MLDQQWGERFSIRKGEAFMILRHVERIVDIEHPLSKLCSTNRMYSTLTTPSIWKAFLVTFVLIRTVL